MPGHPPGLGALPASAGSISDHATDAPLAHFASVPKPVPAHARCNFVRFNARQARHKSGRFPNWPKESTERRDDRWEPVPYRACKVQATSGQFHPTPEANVPSDLTAGTSLSSASIPQMQRGATFRAIFPASRRGHRYRSRAALGRFLQSTRESPRWVPRMPWVIRNRVASRMS
jgi:hypothetical protein